MNQFTDRQIALQAAVEFSKNSGSINNSFDVVMVAERFRKFLEDKIVEVKTTSSSEHLINATRKQRVGNG